MPTWSTTSTPSWYRPTRVCHVTAVRCGAGEAEQASDLNSADTLPAAINIGPGSQPEPYLDTAQSFPPSISIFILDWSWGKIHAVHLEPDGSSYKGTKETFIRQSTTSYRHHNSP